jgi:hypothetical protein
MRDAHVSTPQGGHERSDVAIRPLVWIAVILVAVTIVVHVALWLAMRTFERDERRADPPRSPVAELRAVPPEPRLQPTRDHHPSMPWTDLKAMREHNDRVLSTAGWVDRERGVARIPIEQAMQMLLERSQRGATTQGVQR